MQVRFTSIVWDDIAETVSLALISLEERLVGEMEGKSYGTDIGSFMGILVAVDDEDNKRFARPHNRVGFVTNGHGVRFKQISLAVEMSPADLTGKGPVEIANVFARALCEKLGNHPLKLPRGFDWSGFSETLRAALYQT